MRACTTCNHPNREGALVCEDCGFPIGLDSPTLPTRQLELPDDVETRPTWGTAHFDRESAVTLHIRDASEPLILQTRDRIILGRYDSTSLQKPDCDLSPYGALEKGVSRIHAAIYRQEETLTLIDMSSSNGTHLNGQRLIPEQPRILRDGDEIRLGKLVTHIYFRRRPAQRPPG